MAKKENVQSHGNSLLQTATYRRLGASRLALTALRSGARPPVKKVKVSSSDASRVSDITGSVATMAPSPAIVREIQAGDIDVDSSVMGMSFMSTSSSGMSVSGVGKSGHSTIGTAVKTTPQPKSRAVLKKAAEPRVLVKKSMEIQNGIKFTSPSPMTLDRCLVQKSQERTAPASEEYQLKQEEEREKKNKEMKKQKAEQKKMELRKQLELELGEGFEAQIDTSHITNPVAAAAIKKKSLVKKILNKMKPKSPAKNREGVVTGNDKPPKPITAMEARSLARKALDASKQRRMGNADPVTSKQNLATGAAPGTFPIAEIKTEQKQDSISDLDSSVKRFPVNEIMMNKNSGPGGDDERDDDTVSTLGAPVLFDRFDRTVMGSRLSESIPGQSVPFFLTGNNLGGGGPDPESGTGPQNSSAAGQPGGNGQFFFQTEVLNASGTEDGSRVRHRLGGNLVDNMDMTAGSDDTGAIEVIMGRCNPSGVIATKDPKTGKLVVRSMDPIDYALAALCPTPAPITAPSDPPVKNQDTNTASKKEYNQENMKPMTSMRRKGPLSPVREELRTPNSVGGQPLQAIHSAHLDTRGAATALSPTSKFTFAIDEAIRNVQTQLSKNQTSGDMSLMTDLDAAPGGVLEALDTGSSSKLSNANMVAGQNSLSPIVEGKESAGASPRSNRSQPYGEPYPSSPVRSAQGFSSTEGSSLQDGPSSPKNLNSKRASTHRSEGSGSWVTDGKDGEGGSVGSDRYSVPDLEGGDDKQNAGNVAQKPALGFMSTLALMGSDLFWSMSKKNESTTATGAVIDLTNLESQLDVDDNAEKAKKVNQNDGSLRSNRIQPDIGDIMALAETRLSGRQSGQQDFPEGKSPRINEKSAKMQKPVHKASVFRFDDMMDIAEAKLMSSTDKGFSDDDDVKDRHFAGDGERSPRPVIVGHAVESTECDGSIPVVRGVEVTPSKKKSPHEKTPKASGAGRTRRMKVDTAVTLDDESQTDIEVYYDTTYESPQHEASRVKKSSQRAKPDESLLNSMSGSTEDRRQEVSTSINAGEYKVKKVGGKITPRRTTSQQALDKMPGNREGLARKAPLDSSFDVYEDEDGNEVLCYEVDRHGLVRRSPEAKRKDDQTARSRGPPKPDEGGRMRKSTQAKKMAQKAAFVSSLNQKSFSTTNGFAGYFSDGLFDLLSAEESTATKDTKGKSAGFSTSSDGLEAHDEEAQRLTRHINRTFKRNGDSDALDFVCEYSEHVVCGKVPERLTNGPIELKERGSAPNAGEDQDDDYMSDASTLGSSLAHMAKNEGAPNMGLMCGAVPLYLLYSMKSLNEADEDAEEEKKYGRSPRGQNRRARSQGRKSPRKSPRSRKSGEHKSSDASIRRRRDSKPSYASKSKNQDTNESDSEDSILNAPTSPAASHLQADTVKRATNRKEKQSLSPRKEKQPLSPRQEKQSLSPTPESLHMRGPAQDRQPKKQQGSSYVDRTTAAALEQPKGASESRGENKVATAALKSDSVRLSTREHPVREATMALAGDSQTGGSLPVLLENDDAYWDTLSTIASTKDRSSDNSKQPQPKTPPKPGPIPVEITMKTKAGDDDEGDAGEMEKNSKTPATENEQTKVKSCVADHPGDSSLAYSIETSDELQPKDVKLEPGTKEMARESTVSRSSRVAGLIAKFENARAELDEGKQSGSQHQRTWKAENHVQRSSASHLDTTNDRNQHRGVSWGYEEVFEPLEPPGRTGTMSPSHNQRSGATGSRDREGYDEEGPRKYVREYVQPHEPAFSDVSDAIHSIGSEGYAPVSRVYSEGQNPSQDDGNVDSERVLCDTNGDPARHSSGSEGYEPVQRSYSTSRMQESGSWNEAIQAEEAYEEAYRLSQQHSDRGYGAFAHNGVSAHERVGNHTAGELSAQFVEEEDSQGSGSKNYVSVENYDGSGTAAPQGGERSYEIPISHSHGSDGYEPPSRSFSARSIQIQTGSHPAEDDTDGVEYLFAISPNMKAENPDDAFLTYGRVDNPTTHSNGSEGLKPIQLSPSAQGIPSCGRDTIGHKFKGGSANPTNNSIGSGGYDPLRRSYSPNPIVDTEVRDGSSSGSDSPYSLYEKLPGELSKGTGRQRGWGFEEPRESRLAFDSGTQGPFGSPRTRGLPSLSQDWALPDNSEPTNFRMTNSKPSIFKTSMNHAIEPTSSQSDATESDGSQQEFQRASARPSIAHNSLLQQTIDRSSEIAAAASKGFVAAAAAALIAGDKLVNSASKKGEPTSTSQRNEPEEEDDASLAPQEGSNALDLKGDRSKKDLTVEEEQKLISRTLELSKAILSSVNAQGLNSMSDDEIAQSLLTEDGNTKMKHSTDTVPGQGFVWPTVPVSVSFLGGITLTESIQTLIKSEEAAMSRNESTSTPSFSQISQESPVDLNKLFSKYDSIAHQLIDQHGQLKRTIKDPSGQPQSDGSEHTTEIMSRLDELRRQRARALARFENPNSSVDDTAAEDRDPTDLPAREDLAFQSRIRSPAKATGSRARDLLKKYYYGGDSVDSQESRLDREADAARSKSTGRGQLSHSNDPRRAKSAERPPQVHSHYDGRDAESVSTASNSTKTTASLKARELRKQLDEALKASKAIRESQESLGLELRTFKKRFYEKNNALEDQAFQAMEHASGV